MPNHNIHHQSPNRPRRRLPPQILRPLRRAIPLHPRVKAGIRPIGQTGPRTLNPSTTTTTPLPITPTTRRGHPPLNIHPTRVIPASDPQLLMLMLLLLLLLLRHASQPRWPRPDSQRRPAAILGHPAPTTTALTATTGFPRPPGIAIRIEQAREEAGDERAQRHGAGDDDGGVDLDDGPVGQVGVGVGGVRVRGGFGLDEDGEADQFDEADAGVGRSKG